MRCPVKSRVVLGWMSSRLQVFILPTLAVCLSFSRLPSLLIKVTALPGIHFLESVFPGYQQDLCLLSGPLDILASGLET